MSKGKGPRKRRQPAPEQPPAGDEKEIERQTEAKADLVPLRPGRAVQSQPFGLVDFVNALRDALGKLLDLADATADAITKRRA